MGGGIEREAVLGGTTVHFNYNSHRTVHKARCVNGSMFTNLDCIAHKYMCGQCAATLL